MQLYKHKNNLDVAVEVLSFYQPEGKSYARIRVRWWNISSLPYSMRITQYLTTAETYGKNKDTRTKYPIDKWKNDWVPVQITLERHK